MLSIGWWVLEVEWMSLVLFVEVYTEHEVYVVYTSFVRKNCSYDTNELSAPTTNTKRIQRADPDNTRPFDDAYNAPNHDQALIRSKTKIKKERNCVKRNASP